MADVVEVRTSGDVAAAMDGIVRSEMARVGQIDYRRTLREIVLRRLRIWHASYFAKDEDPEGRPWPVLHPITVARKGHDTILEDTQALLRSLIGNSKYSIVRITKSENGASLEYGTNRPNAWRHMVGQHQDPERNLPIRKMVGLSQRRIDSVVKLIADDAIKQLSAENGKASQ